MKACPYPPAIVCVGNAPIAKPLTEEASAATAVYRSSEAMIKTWKQITNDRQDSIEIGDDRKQSKESRCRTWAYRTYVWN